MDSQVTQENAVDLKRAKRTFSRIGFALIVYFAAAYGAAFLLQIILLNFVSNGEALLQSPTVTTAISAVAMYIVAFPVFLLMMLPLKPAKREKGRVRPATVVTLTLIAYFFLYVGNFLGIAASGIFESFFHFSLEEATLELIGKLHWGVALAVAGILGPLVEECIFRKWILDRTRVYGEKLAILFSALTFALFHMSVQQFFYAFFIGLLLGYLYIRSGSLRAVWVIHAALNIFGSVIPLALNRYCNYEELLLAAMESPEAMAEQMLQNPIAFGVIFLYSSLTTAMLVLGAILYFRFRRRVYFEPAEQTLPQDTEATVAFTGIGVILFIALCVITPIALHFLTVFLEQLFA